MMNGSALQYDDANMHHATVGRAGITVAAWEAMRPTLHAAKQEVLRLTEAGEQGFLALAFARRHVNEVRALASRFAKRYTDLVVLGIGGSDLGARMIQEALIDPSAKRAGMRVHFGGSSTDPDALQRLLKTVDLKRTCVNIVSKSGGTLEPMASFLVFRDRLIRAVGRAHMPAHIIATTDPSDGLLRSLAEQEGYATLSIPPNVGGRFSVLSAAGLFPAACMGVDIRALLSGARDAVQAFRHTDVSHCPVGRYAGLHAHGWKEGRPIHVTVPYSPRLQCFGQWLRQLVGESLGKSSDHRSNHEPIGITPVTGTGPEDQHSQLQLWSQGPHDKLITFIEIHRFNARIHTPQASKLDPALAFLDHRSFEDLVHIERAATAEALRQDHRPNGTIFVDRLDASTLGRLILFFELSVALMGQLLRVDAYNQPGVERSKQLMKAQLAG
ncbi:MAG: hypothetical protein RL141_589 [Candidatus Parcubacteria bacterium]|jgi:glucose-6-phosphate isomerase